MAEVPATTQAGEVWSGLATAGSIPSVLRKEGIDEATKLTYLTRKWNSFTWLLHNNYKSTQHVVNDRKYITREISEFERFYTVQAASTQSGSRSVITLTNTEAAQVQPQDVLYPKKLYATVTGLPLVAGQVYAATSAGQGTNIGPDLGWATGLNPTSLSFSRVKGPDGLGNYFVEEEQMVVLEVRAKNSGGAGFTQILVERCWFGPSAHDEGGKIIDRSIVATALTNQSAIATLQPGDVLLRGMPVYKEGTNYPGGVFKNPISDNNFTQLFKYAVGKTLESDIPATWISERPLDIYRWLTLQRMNRDREYANLLGRKGMERDADGAETYIAGGAREFIPKDADHYLIYPNATISWPAVLDMSIPLLNLNNSGEMWGITGVSLDIALRKSFYNEHLWYNKEDSKAFNMEVNTLMLAGIKINLIVSQIFEEAGYGNELMLLDMSNGDSFEPVTNQGWDYRVDKDIAEKGANLYKEGIQGMFGLRRRRRDHHAIIDFSNAVKL